MQSEVIVNDVPTHIKCGFPVGRLDRAGVLQVLESLAVDGQIEWKDARKEGFYIFFQSPTEIANAIYDWARKSAKIGKIETLKWISSGDDTMKTESTSATSLQPINPVLFGRILQPFGRNHGKSGESSGTRGSSTDHPFERKGHWCQVPLKEFIRRIQRSSKIVTTLLQK